MREQRRIQPVASAILEFEELSFDEDAIRAHARRFSRERFRTEMTHVILDQHRALAPA